MSLKIKYAHAFMVLIAGLMGLLFSFSSMANPRAYEAGGSSNQAVGELFYQLQIMQEEMAILRGTVEELQNELTQLKSQRLKDYKGLDKRIQALSSPSNSASSPNSALSSQVGLTPQAGPTDSASQAGSADSAPKAGSDVSAQASSAIKSTGASAAAGVASAADKAASSVKSTVQPTATPAPKGDERARYRAAYSLVKAKKFKEAKVSLQQYLKDYPSAHYTPNGMYWLAELHLIDKEYPQAKALFKGISTRFAAHRKTPDARFKLAKIHHIQGDKATAQQMLKAITADYSASAVNAAKLASNFLKKHYP